MKNQHTNTILLNNHWNNCLCFCALIELYLILSYSVKWGDVGFLKIAMREIAIILQAPSVKKSRYVRKILGQIYILDRKGSDPILQNAYIVNSLVNFRDLPFTFYEINLLFEHQNGEFKRFRGNHGSFLQETNEIFQLYALLVDGISKVRRFINRIVIEQEHSRRYPIKDELFDIQSFIDQLY